MPAKPIEPADLILKLYERVPHPSLPLAWVGLRETVMREARSYIGGEFLPSSADEPVSIVTDGGRLGGFVFTDN